MPCVSTVSPILPLLLKSRGNNILQQVKRVEKYNRESFVAETGFMGKVKREIEYLYDFFANQFY